MSSLCRRQGWAAGTVLLAATLVAAVPARAVDPLVSRHRLANGMTVLVRENHTAATVAASLQVDASSQRETEVTAGITNFVHRVMIRGTSARSAVQLAESAEEIGGNLDASGDADHGEIRGQALAQHWEALLSLIANVALEPTLPAEEVERERRLILSQIQSRADNPFPLAYDTLLKDLYGAHPYALPAVGLRPSIEGITREAILTHHRAIYLPDRLVLALSGDVNAERVVRMTERLFGKRSRGPAAERSPWPVPMSAGGRRVVEKPAQQAQILVGYLAPSLKDPDYAAVKVMSAVLGAGMSSRLFVELRDRRGLAYSLGAINPPRVATGTLISYMGTAPQNAEAAEAAVLHEIGRLRSEPPGDSEVARAKAHVLGSLVMDRRTNARQAWYLAFFELVGAGWEFPVRSARAVEALTAGDVATAAQRYLERPTIVVLRPPR